MKSITKFEFSRLLPGLHQVAARKCWEPLRTDLEITDDCSPINLVKLLMAKWRARLVELRQTGWREVENMIQLTYAMNCPPATVA